MSWEHGGPRTLHIGDVWVTGRPGGLARYQADLGAALRRADAVERHLVVNADGVVPFGVVTVSGSQRSLLTRLVASTIAARRLAPDCDLVDVHFAPYALGPLYLTRLRRRPMLLHFQGPWASESAMEASSWTSVWLKRCIELIVYRRADRVITLSQAFADIATGQYGIEPALISVIPPGVDTDRFRPGERARARADLGLPAGGHVVVCVRRLAHRMGLDMLLEAWRLVHAADPSAVLLLVGDGAARPALEALSSRLGLAAHVRFLGRVSDDVLVTSYQASDLSVVPTAGLEGFGLVVLESLACGTVVVGTDVDGLAEAIRPFDPGLIVPADDAPGLARMILEVLGSSKERHGVQACRAYAESRSWDVVAAEHLDIYRTLCRPSGTLRVTYLDHTAALGGGEIALSRLLGAANRPFEAEVLLGADGPLPDLLAAASIPTRTVPFADAGRTTSRSEAGSLAGIAGALISSVSWAWRIRKDLRRVKPNILHTNSLKAGLIGGLAGRWAGVPVVWHVRDRIAPDYLPPALVRLVHFAARHLPAGVIANSQTTLACLPTLKVPCVVLPSPIPDGTPTSRTSRTVQRVGIVGRLAAWKGQNVFLEAFAAAFPDGDVEAVVIGAPLFGGDDVEYAHDLRQLALALGVDDRVDFRGFQEDIPAELARLDLLVHASILAEPFGLVVLEGMAAGLPVVATDAGGPSELIDDERTGLLVPMGDPTALAAALRRLHGDPALRSRLGRAAAVAAEAYRAEHVAAETAMFYERVLRSRS